MAYNPILTERVRKALSHMQYTEKKMFGSIGFIINGKLCMGVGDHTDHVMMVRVGPAIYEESLKKKGARPAIMRGKEYKGYIFLLDEAIHTDEDLHYWIQLALKFNSIIK